MKYFILQRDFARTSGNLSLKCVTCQNIGEAEDAAEDMSTSDTQEWVLTKNEVAALKGILEGY